ncbi:MAG: carboxypeptidase regulatory-like domain-containing protein [Bacteroidales bacterium]|nr:carboxypeptidase regulatory-like domain-containing protein [Bacteroidales bacterium]
MKYAPVFAFKTMESVKANGGSGYSWWSYQNLEWPGFNQSYGLLYSGNCNPITCTTLEKPLVEEFRNFNPENYSYNPQKPSNYYNPHYYDLSGVNLNSQTIEGAVVDENGNPIEDAVVTVKTRIGTSGPTFLHYTFTDENGHFEILPYDEDISLPPDIWPRQADFINLKISAAGAERSLWGASGNILTPPQPIHPDNEGDIVNGNTYMLKQQKFEYELSVENLTIEESKPELLKAWNKIYANNLTVSSSVIGDIKAHTEIYLSGETHLSAGSELRLYNTITFADCTCFMGDFRSDENTVVLNNTHSKGSNTGFEKTIQASFQTEAEELHVKVFPNPAKKYC